MGDGTLEEFLSDEKAWVRTIEISYKLWQKEIPASTIQALIREYDEKKEIELKNQQEEEVKFNESAGRVSDGEDDAVMIGRLSQPLRTNSSNDIDLQPSAEISPQKQVNGSDSVVNPQSKKFLNPHKQKIEESKADKNTPGGSSSDDLDREVSSFVDRPNLPSEGLASGQILMVPSSTAVQHL